MNISILLSILAIVLLAESPSSMISTGALPDPRFTPGDTLDVTVADICTTGYTKRIRHVPAGVKHQVYAEYAREPREGVCCEVDHLVPLELGGSNRTKNLWPEPYDIAWNAHVKDRLEGQLHRMVCAGELDLATAQKAIAKDWLAAYQQYGSRTLRSKRRRN